MFDSSDASYQAMCLRLQDAYKRPASEFRTISSDFRTPRGLNHFGSFSNRSGSRDAAEPDMSSPPDKDKLYEARKSELSNMWRMTGPAPGPQATHIGPGVSGHVNEIGRRDPAAAGRNERELEQMRSPQ